ncbi:MAG: RpiB/LacA/LacB family sugar-phosphate isomerase [Ruthenibacterium lactatiformans]|uniref:RpiB/LacA/LacB family sugar-phosphate isomerase n=1 Tax=Ruthenibacterium lactatiformans TaxID=1550024 RepID=UPI003995C3C0
MKIAIASDASGFRLKEHVKQVLREAGHDVTDVASSGRMRPCAITRRASFWRAPL